MWDITQTGGIIEVADLIVKGQKEFQLEVPCFQVNEPAIIAIIGHNGSGKSTFLEALLNLLAPENGTVKILGERLELLPAHHPIRYAIGAQLQNVTWPASIKVHEIIAMCDSIYKKRDNQALVKLGVKELLAMSYNKMSTGQKRRVDLATAISHSPRLIVLDEPAAGLDKQYHDAYLDLMSAWRGHGSTVLLATHDARDIEIADRVVIFEKGRVIHDDKPVALLGQLVGDHVCRIEDVDPIELKEVAALMAETARTCRCEGNTLSCTGPDEMRARFLREVERRGLLSYSVRLARPADLLDLFIRE
jgi:ABC-2 type transport system ATP-binding protein